MKKKTTKMWQNFRPVWAPIVVAGGVLLLILSMPVWLINIDKKGKVLSWIDRQPAVTLVSTGDLMMGRSVNYKGNSKKDFGWSLAKVQKWLENFDLAIVNLETPVIENCPLTNEGMIFCADARSAVALQKNGVGLATLANNHIYNHGREGLAETKEWLQKAGVMNVAEGEFVQKNIGGEKFGFLAWDDVSQEIDKTNFSQTIATKSQLVDHLIVSLHFGREYAYQPTKRQQELAHLAIDSGAEILLGNHSHWLGPIEIYGGGVIVYSHGNFVFDQMWSEETRTGMAIAWQFKNGGLQSLQVTPIWITDYGLANRAEDKKGEEILQTIQTISDNIGEIKAGQLVIELPTHKAKRKSFIWLER